MFTDFDWIWTGQCNLVLLFLLIVDEASKSSMLVLASRADGIGSIPLWFATSGQGVVELLVVVSQNLRWLFPLCSKLTVVEYHSVRLFVLDPFSYQWMSPKLRASRMISCIRSKSLFAASTLTLSRPRSPGKPQISLEFISRNGGGPPSCFRADEKVPHGKPNHAPIQLGL